MGNVLPLACGASELEFCRLPRGPRAQLTLGSRHANGRSGSFHLWMQPYTGSGVDPRGTLRDWTTPGRCRAGLTGRSILSKPSLTFVPETTAQSPHTASPEARTGVAGRVTSPRRCSLPSVFTPIRFRSGPDKPQPDLWPDRWPSPWPDRWPDHEAAMSSGTFAQVRLPAGWPHGGCDLHRRIAFARLTPSRAKCGCPHQVRR